VSKQQKVTRPNEHTFAAVLEFDLTGEISYPMKILNQPRSPSKIRWLMRMLKGPNVGIQMLRLAAMSMVLIVIHLPLYDLLQQRSIILSRAGIVGCGRSPKF
jgi:hypothetical protein